MRGSGFQILIVNIVYFKTFCGFSMGRNQYWAGRVYDLCVYYMTGTPEGSTESSFMEKLYFHLYIMSILLGWIYIQSEF